MNDELLKTCIHEYGHFEIARALGVYSFVEIWRNESGDPDEKAWRGRTNLQLKPTGETRVLICLAGVVAETLLVDFAADGYTLEDAEREAATIRSAFPTGRLSRRTGFTEFCRNVAERIDDSAFADELSDSDLAGMAGYSQRHIRKTVRLVLANAEAIRQAATLHYEWLIACG